MQHYSDKQMREVFHLLFLEHLLKTSSSGVYVLKGGVNLRFFLNSPRYSEDMDLDVSGVAVPTLKKNGYKIIENPAFRRALATYGIVDIKINDPSKAKQTETTQRFRVRLVNQAGEEFPTQVEFSRRTSLDKYAEEEINPAITGPYKRLSYSCKHYEGAFAVVQKIHALAGRTEVQARDVFDLYLLYLGNHFDRSTWNLEKNVLRQAQTNAISITHQQYHDQVEMYLDPEGSKAYGGKKFWDQIQSKIVDELE